MQIEVKAYMGAINDLRSLINQEYEDGGWLPAGRGMATKLKVSYVTYRKALAFLADEGHVKSFPKKGHYVLPLHLRIHKVGFILLEGKECPFIHGLPYATAAMDYLSQNHYEVQLIQATSLDQLYDTALVHGTEGLIWFFPPPSAHDEILKICACDNLPLVAIDHNDSQAHEPAPLVSYDSASGGSLRAELMIDHGHRSIAYIGKYQDAVRMGMVDIFQNANVPFEPENCIADMVNSKADLLEWMAQHKVTGIISEGNPLQVNCLFEALSELPDEQQPEVLVTHFAKLPMLHRRYPKIQLLKMEHTLRQNLGLEAAKMLISHLKCGTPLHDLRIGLSPKSHATDTKH